MKLHRVAITGLGCMTSLGNNLEKTWGNIIQGKSGIQKITHLELPNISTKIGSFIKDYSICESLLKPTEMNRFDRFIHFGLKSAHEAMSDAGLLEDFIYPSNKMGCILGVGMGGFPITEKSAIDWAEKEKKKVSPFLITGIIPNMATGLISIKLGLQGPNYTVSSACASSSHALSAASYEIMSGRQDVVISGGTEGVVSDLCLGAFSSMRALSKRNDDPEKASRPFDADRDGFVMGEGAGILVLENFEKARARGAKIYAEIVGMGANSDANHIAAPREDGLGASACMLQAIESSGVALEEIGYINAHGTSTPLGDLAETVAIKHTFGKHAYKTQISSTKSMTGHLLGAAGGLETLFCAKALKEGVLPPTINLVNQDPKCDLDYTANKAKKVDVEYALNNSFGFGGTNSSILLRKVS